MQRHLFSKKPSPSGDGVVTFVQGWISVPEKVHIHNGSVIGWFKEVTTVDKALGVNFDYSEIMRRG